MQALHTNSNGSTEFFRFLIPLSSCVQPTVGSKRIPAYGKRKGWTPRTPADFGDGGAFPEIHVAQFPLGMGQKESSKNVLALSLNAEGRVQYDQLLRQGQGKDKIIHSTYDALVPVQITHDDPKRELPDEDAIKEQTEKVMHI